VSIKVPAASKLGDLKITGTMLRRNNWLIPLVNGVCNNNLGGETSVGNKALCILKPAQQGIGVIRGPNGHHLVIVGGGRGRAGAVEAWGPGAEVCPGLA
jgi:hypothetical protein